MAVVIEVLAFFADLAHHFLGFFGDGDSIRGNWSTVFESPAGGECFEIYRLAELRRTTFVFIQQYKPVDRSGIVRRRFNGQGVRHGDLLYAYYNSVDSQDDRAGVMVLERSHDPETLAKRVRAQYWEAYPVGGNLKEIKAAIHLQKLTLSRRQKLKLIFGRYLFESYEDAMEHLAGRSSELKLGA
jgi:hypothetical protein